MIDPTIARAWIEIANDRALLRKLVDSGSPGALPKSPEVQARIASLRRLIAANEAFLARSNG